MNELTAVRKTAEWQRLKPLVLDSVSSPITKRVYNMALDEFFRWYDAEPRPGFSKATVSAWRVSLEERGLGSSSIIVRMSAVRKLAVEATDNGLLAPELAAGIQRVKSAKSIGVRGGNWLSLKQAQSLLNAPDISTLKGLRERAIIAVLLSCALRDPRLRPDDSPIQQRDGRWRFLKRRTVPPQPGPCSFSISGAYISPSKCFGFTVPLSRRHWPKGENNDAISNRSSIGREVRDYQESLAGLACRPVRHGHP